MHAPKIKARKKILKRHPHTPAHLFLDETPYFITGAIYEKRHLLQSVEIKRLLLKQMNKYFRNYGWELYHWVILDNHYHLMAKSRVGKDLSRIMQGIHGGTSVPIQRVTGAKKPIWWNYWDYCLHDERDYRVRLNYLLWNPVKHAYVKDLAEYPYSSYHRLLAEEGEERIEVQLFKYPQYKDCVLREAEDDDF